MADVLRERERQISDVARQVFIRELRLKQAQPERWPLEGPERKAESRTLLTVPVTRGAATMTDLADGRRSPSASTRPPEIRARMELHGNAFRDLTTEPVDTPLSAQEDEVLPSIRTRVGDGNLASPRGHNRWIALTTDGSLP